jgi:hypothetical protein
MRALGNDGPKANNVESNLSRFQRWAKRLGGIRRARKTTEITVQTDRILVIRRRRPFRAWCYECGCETDMLTIDEVGSMTSAGLPPSLDAQPGWHLSQAEDGTGLVCLDSFLKSL